MSEEQAAEKWLDTVLSAAAAVSALVGARIYSGMAPQGAAFPYVLFNLQSGRDTNTSGSDGRRILARLTYQVRATVEGASFAPADAIASALDAAIAGGEGAVVISGQTYDVQGCYRLSGIRRPEVSGGKQYRHSGGLYRLVVSARP